MKGNNELKLNEATMIEVVQEWLDRQLPAGAPTITSVKGGGNQYDLTFTVMMSSEAARPEQQAAAVAVAGK